MLSEVAGVSSYLEGCIKFNPANKFEIVNAICRGVTMGSKERTERYEEMYRFVNEHTR